jgi:hypothetical protein
LWLIPAQAEAAAGAGSRPSEHWSDMQKLEFYLGQVGGALNICGFYSLSTELQKLAKLSPYGRKGLASMAPYDGIRGGYCGKLAADGEALLTDKDQLRTYLLNRYDCPGGTCAPQHGDGSPSAACRPEVDDHLKTLPLKTEDVQSVSMVSRNAGATRLTTGRAGHEAWIRLNSCNGWLIIEMSKGCYPRQSFTRGDCAIEGIKGF